MRSARGQPRLPVELDREGPEPLQAIALKAMEADPGLSLQTAQDMDAGSAPVHRRPAGPGAPVHLRLDAREPDSGRTSSEIGEWLRLRLIYPHEADRLRHAYGALDETEDDWKLESRDAVEHADRAVSRARSC